MIFLFFYSFFFFLKHADDNSRTCCRAGKKKKKEEKTNIVLGPDTSMMMMNFTCSGCMQRPTVGELDQLQREWEGGGGGWGSACPDFERLLSHSAAHNNRLGISTEQLAIGSSLVISLTTRRDSLWVPHSLNKIRTAVTTTLPTPPNPLPSHFAQSLSS